MADERRFDAWQRHTEVMLLSVKKYLNPYAKTARAAGSAEEIPGSVRDLMIFVPPDKRPKNLGPMKAKRKP